MAKVLRTIAVVAGAVALIATGIGAVGGAAFAASALGGTIATVAQIAGVVAGVAGIGAQLLTKPPPARGSVTETIIDVNPPSPYGMGEGYFGGVLRHKVGYGPTLKKVPNPFLFEAVALCVAGPIAGPIVPQVDFGPVTSYYSGWLATDTRLGQRPDTALTAPLQANPTGWSSSHRLSSVAAIAWNHKFDKDGKIYASGLPTRGVVAKWALCYDPRKDSTRPGGSGSHRLGIETTYEWSENPALHAGTYAYGRFVNGKRVIGVGLPDEGIDWEGVAAWANDCQANGWRMFGFVFEGAADDAQRRWQNLRDICIAGGGEPLFSGAVLGFHWHRPRVPLDTVTEADLAEGPQEVTAMKSWRDRLNTVRPRYTSPAHNWSLVQAQQVQVASYLAEDGEERAEDIPFNFVKDVNQAAQLAAYWLTNSRELSPITLTLMPRLRNYRPGECLRLQLPELGLDHDAVILRREFDPGSMTVTLTLVTEDPAKHAFALGRTGTAPPTPSLTNSAEDRDTITREARAPYWPEVDGPGRPEDGATNTAPANANRVPFSRIEGGRGWSSFLGTVASITPIFPNVVDGRRYIVANATASAAGQIASIAGTDLFPVQPGERLSVSLNLNVFEIAGPAPAFWQVIIDYFLGDTAVSAPVVFSGTGNIGGDALREGFVTVPSGVTRARLVLLAQSGGAGTFQLNILHPMVTSAAAGQTVHPDYTPGPNASDGADPNNLITIDGAGIISGIGTANITVNNAVLPLGNANRVPFSRFEGGRGWGIFASSFASNSGLAPLIFQGRTFINVDATASAAGQGIFIGNAPTFAVIPGERLSVSSRLDAFALSGQPPSNWSFYIEYRQGTTILSNTIIASGSGNAPSAIGTRHEGFSTVPPGADNAYLVLAAGSSGTGVLRIALLEPMVTSAASGQTVHPPFTPGPNARDGADPNSDILISGGVISGIGTANIFVDNARAVLQSLASARPASGEYLNQVHFATDTLVASQWDGFNWRSSADITFAVSGPGEVVLDYDSTGAIVTPLPTSTSYLLTPAGGVALTSGVSWSVAVVSGTFSGAAPSISGTGTGILQNNSPMTSNEAVLRITGTVAGRSYPPMTVRVTKRTAAPAGGGGGFASTTSFNAVSTSSFAALTGDLNVVLPSGSTAVALTAASLGVSLAAALPLGSTTFEIKWQRESSPGVWSDVGAAATSSPSPFVQTEGGGIYSVDPGSITCNRTATGLSGGSTQKFRLVGRVSAGNVRSVFTTGTASAQA